MSVIGFQSSFKVSEASDQVVCYSKVQIEIGMIKNLENQAFMATSGVRQAFLGTVTAALDPFVREADAEPDER